MADPEAKEAKELLLRGLAISVLATIAPCLLSQLLAGFRQEYPGVEVRDLFSEEPFSPYRPDTSLQRKRTVFHRAFERLDASLQCPYPQCPR